MAVTIDGTSGINTPGVVNTAAETIATTLAVTGVTTFAAGTAALPAITTTGDTNTGIFFPAADRIGFAEGGVQVGEFDASSNFLFNSGYGSVAVGYGCRAWVNFNGTGTVAISGSGNVSSITDNGTGDYSVNFTTAMPDNTYAVCATAKNGSSFNGLVASNELPNNTTSLAKIFTTNSTTDVLVDGRGISVAIFR